MMELCEQKGQRKCGKKRLIGCKFQEVKVKSKILCLAQTNFKELS